VSGRTRGRSSRGSPIAGHKARNFVGEHALGVVLRRITDHLVDHLCQVEARSAGVTPVPDPWRGRAVTLDSDWARFTEQDLDEASARIRRLAQVLAIRLLALRPSWDEEAGEEWTIRAIAEHVAEASATYAGQPRSPASPARDGAQR